MDRGFANPAWKLQFLETTIHHLLAIHSDHKPLLIHTTPPPNSLPKPFCFQAMWLTHPDSYHIVNSAWNKSPSFLSRLKNTKSALKTWNHLVFGNIQSKIQSLKHTINTLQSSPMHSTLQDMENAALDNLDELYKCEELFWKEKAKSKWLQEGDSNTHFFHLTTIIHRKQNRIVCILDNDHNWIHDRHLIGIEFVTYFSNLFAIDLPLCPQDLQNLIQPHITNTQNQQLLAIPDLKEIKQALFSMGNYKSPGPDGFIVTFYKHYWGIVEHAVVEEIHTIF